jgi:hypothetical protein
VSIIAQEDGLKDVRVRTQDSFPKTSPLGHSRRAQELVPVLRGPDGILLPILLWGDGGSGGEQHWTARAVGQTEMTAAELESHLARQLTGAGWTRVAQAVAGPVASSTWIVPGAGEKELYGLLLVAETPAKGRQLLLLWVDTAVRPLPGQVGSMIQ